MILTVTPNPAVDVTLTVARLDLGHTHRVAPGVRRAGGKGINVARVLNDMGADAVAIAPVGFLDREWFAGNLTPVPSELLDVPGNLRQSTALVEPDRTTILNETGVELGADVWPTLVDLVTADLHRASCLVISGSIPPGCPPTLYGELVSAARSHGVPVIADATGAALLAAATAGATVLKPNLTELVDTTGHSDPVAGARALQALGAGLVLVSLGENGMIAVPSNPDEPVLRARLGRILRGNPTGAGDAAVAGIASLLAGSTSAERSAPEDPRHPVLNVDALLRRGTAWSAAAVLEPLAGSVDPLRVADIEAELEITAVEDTSSTLTTPSESTS